MLKDWILPRMIPGFKSWYYIKIAHETAVKELDHMSDCLVIEKNYGPRIGYPEFTQSKPLPMRIFLWLLQLNEAEIPFPFSTRICSTRSSWMARNLNDHQSRSRQNTSIRSHHSNASLKRSNGQPSEHPKTQRHTCAQSRCLLVAGIGLLA